MEVTRLSSKGQIIIPKSLREAYAWEPGLEFIIIDTGDGLLLKPKRPFPHATLDEVAGSLRYTGKPKSLSEMDDAIAKGVQEQWHGRR